MVENKSRNRQQVCKHAPLVDPVLCPGWSAGPRIPPQDVVEVVRVDKNVDRSRKGTEYCVNRLTHDTV